MGETIRILYSKIKGAHLPKQRKLFAYEKGFDCNKNSMKRNLSMLKHSKKRGYTEYVKNIQIKVFNIEEGRLGRF